MCNDFSFSWKSPYQSTSIWGWYFPWWLYLDILAVNIRSCSIHLIDKGLYIDIYLECLYIEYCNEGRVMMKSWFVERFLFENRLDEKLVLVFF